VKEGGEREEGIVFYGVFTYTFNLYRPQGWSCRCVGWSKRSWRPSISTTSSFCAVREGGREGGKKGGVISACCYFCALPWLRSLLPSLPSSNSSSLPPTLPPSLLPKNHRRDGQRQIHSSTSIPLRVRLHLPFLPPCLLPPCLLLLLLCLALPDRDHPTPASGSSGNSTARGTGDG